MRRLNAYYRIRPDLKRCPEPGDLEKHGQRLLITDMCLLDVLGKLASGETFAELASSSELMRVGHNDIRVQSLESLIHVKELLGSEKDSPSCRHCGARSRRKNASIVSSALSAYQQERDHEHVREVRDEFLERALGVIRGKEQR